MGSENLKGWLKLDWRGCGLGDLLKNNNCSTLEKQDVIMDMKETGNKLPFLPTTSIFD